MPKKAATVQKERMIHVRLGERLHKLLRIQAAVEDMTIQDWVSRLLEQKLAKPNSK